MKGLYGSKVIVNSRGYISLIKLTKNSAAKGLPASSGIIFVSSRHTECCVKIERSSKTTVLGWLLTTIPNNKRIYTIENGSRELDLTRLEDGKVVNSVIHTITRDSENEKQRVDQIMLLDMALRFNPDIVVVGEMRGADANAAQEAARTGIAVLTTIHANSSVRQPFATGTGDVAGAIEGTWTDASSQIKTVVNKVVFLAIDLVLAVFFFAKLGMAYFDYRKHGQFEWAAPAILFACLVFTLTAPIYNWQVLGMW